MRFEIYYSDGGISEGASQLEFLCARLRGILAVVVRNDDGSQELVYGGDYYFMHNGQVHTSNTRPRTLYKFGVLVGDTEWAEFIDAVRSRSKIWNNKQSLEDS